MARVDYSQKTVGALVEMYRINTARMRRAYDADNDALTEILQDSLDSVFAELANRGQAHLLHEGV